MTSTLLLASAAGAEKGTPQFGGADGDGTWQPPGLGEELPDVLTDPDHTP